MKVHKIVLCVVDFDDIGAPGIRDVLENTRYPNRCIRPDVVAVETRDVEWSDGHPLNHHNTQREAFRELFAAAEAKK